MIYYCKQKTNAYKNKTFSSFDIIKIFQNISFYKLMRIFSHAFLFLHNNLLDKIN